MFSRPGRICSGPTLALALICSITGRSFAETSAPDLDCSSIKESAPRLACYDKGHKTKSPEDPNEEEKTAATPDVLKSKPTDPPKRVDAADLAIAPNKFIGKTIELSRTQCFYADKDEYRCLGNSRGGVILLIFAKNVTPEAEKSKLEDACGEIKKMPTAACRRTLRFVPAASADDTVGLEQRTNILTDSVEVIEAGNGNRRR